MSPIQLVGYRHLPVSAALTTAMIVLALAGSILSIRQYFLLAFAPFISQWKQWWRLAIFQLQFQNESQMVIGVVLYTFTFKNIERVFGSTQFSKLVVLLYIYNAIFIGLLLAASYLIFGINIYVPSGPFGVLFGLLYPAQAHNPTLYHIELDFGALNPSNSERNPYKLILTNNFATYLLSTELFFSEGLVSSPIACTVGYIVSALMFNGILPFKNVNFTFLHRIYYRLRQRLHWRRSGYHRLSNSDALRSTSPENVESFTDNDNEPVDRDTPVRSLGSQLLDTFRH